jgi:MoxR-like ATPase
MEENIDRTSESTQYNEVNENLTVELIKPGAAFDFVADIAEKIKAEMQKVIIGQDEVIRLITTGLFSGGHLLLEGVPGVAKTLMVKLLAKTMNTGFKRIQFTPDLMPSDVIGTTVFNMKTSSFYFREGPVFSNFILVDEINRAPAKTQAALFEAMEERQISVDGQTYKLGFPLFIVATQNPIEQEGTYKLPEAQLDRFMFRLMVDYPDLQEEELILKRFAEDFSIKVLEEVLPVLNTDDLKKCMETVQTVHMRDELLSYIAKIVHDTRNNGSIFLGASPRASLAIMKTAKAYAAINGRNFATPDDIRAVAYPVLNHRIMLNPEYEIEGGEAKDVIRGILEKNEVPR